MRVTIEVGDGQALRHLLDREIDAIRTSHGILAAMPPEQRVSDGTHSYGQAVKWCADDLTTYTEIRESLAQALDFEHLQIAYVLSHDNAASKKRTPQLRHSRPRGKRS
jgi:hypothetical protein